MKICVRKSHQSEYIPLRMRYTCSGVFNSLCHSVDLTLIAEFIGQINFHNPNSSGLRLNQANSWFFTIHPICYCCLLWRVYKCCVVFSLSLRFLVLSCLDGIRWSNYVNELENFLCGRLKLWNVWCNFNVMLSWFITIPHLTFQQIFSECIRVNDGNHFMHELHK